LGYWCDWDDPQVLVKLRDALADGDQVVTVTLPSGLTQTARASEIVRKLGSADYGGSYFTFSDENNYTIWGFLKKCHTEGFIYRGHDVMPWCGRCGTGLSQMEVAEGRRITTHTSVFVRFPVKGQENTALLVWTTTPWTLTSNVAVAVNPEMTYLKVRHGDWTYYVAKANFERDRVQDLQVEGKHETHKLQSIRSMLKGQRRRGSARGTFRPRLTRSHLHGPFDELPAQNAPGGVFPYGETGAGRSAAESHRVIAWNEVSEAEGTGWSTSRPGCGAEDQQLGKGEGICRLSHRWTRAQTSRTTSDRSPAECQPGGRRGGGGFEIHRVSGGARNVTRTSTRTAGAAKRNWFSAPWTNGSSAWIGATASNVVPPSGGFRPMAKRASWTGCAT
jgi:isoleucyl-tRNA synthetase